MTARSNQETPASSALPERAARLVQLKIRRQDGPDRPETRRWEEFEVAYLPRMNVISALQQIQKHPVAANGAKVAPVAWDSACADDVCGACTMLINGRVRSACAALIDDVAPRKGPITLEPLSKFPVLRDLVVDRSRIFDALQTVHAWRELDSALAPIPAQREAPHRQARRSELSPCTTCGACLEACPEYSSRSDFLGALAINQVHLHNEGAPGSDTERARLQAVMGPGGVADCGKAQNCVEVCPAGIPLVDSIQEVARATTKELVVSWLFK